MQTDPNTELHARPSIYFTAPAFVEHVALLPATNRSDYTGHRVTESGAFSDSDAKTQVEFHTEFVTVTRVAPVESLDHWPAAALTDESAVNLAGLPQARIVNRTSILVIPEIPADLAQTLKQFGFGDTAASSIGGGSAIACSDFRFASSIGTRVLLLNKDLNSYRLGRMVRRLYEIEAYRSMALLSLPSARALAPMLDGYDAELVTLTNRNLITRANEHKALLDEISQLSAHVICASAENRNRFAASAAYSKIVEERILELREAHVSGFQRYGIFIVRRFRPAMRSCEAAVARLEHLSHATMHLLDLLQTRVQVEIELQNATQIQAMADRAATQVKIQRAVEGLSIIAISYYLLGLIRLLQRPPSTLAFT